MNEAFEHFSGPNNLPVDKWRTEPKHITDAVLFLASENADMISGVMLPVDRGQMT